MPKLGQREKLLLRFVYVSLQLGMEVKAKMDRPWLSCWREATRPSKPRDSKTPINIGRCTRRANDEAFDLPGDALGGIE